MGIQAVPAVGEYMVAAVRGDIDRWQGIGVLVEACSELLDPLLVDTMAWAAFGVDKHLFNRYAGDNVTRVALLRAVRVIYTVRDRPGRIRAARTQAR